MPRSIQAALAAAAMLMAAGSAWALTEDLAAQPITVSADRIDYDRARGLLEARGNVSITSGETVLKADYAVLDTMTQIADAFGDVTLIRAGGTWTGATLSYDFGAERIRADTVAADTPPFHWTAAEVRRDATHAYHLSRAALTTCERPEGRQHYHIRARSVTMLPGEWLTARHAVWYLGGVPVFYLPYYHRDLRDPETGWYVNPGFQTQMGFYALGGYRHRWARGLRSDTHIDYRARRGWALGQDLFWRQPTRGDWSGDLRLYGLHDRQPLRDAADRRAIDAERYRMSFRHAWYPSRNRYLMSQGYLFSDAYVLEDFFRGESHLIRQPENYAAFTHQGESYAFNLSVVKRLNDFYTVTERLPEATLDLFSRPLGDTRLYYRGTTSLGWLQRAWSDATTADDYATLRGDSVHHLSYPFKAFGFLNLVPRASYRGTWYGATRDGEAVGPGRWRSVVDLGQNVSLRAFRVWRDVGAEGRSYRHVIEPYADYRRVFEPNLTPDRLFAFDGRDRLDAYDAVRLGLRNRFQTRVARRTREIVDLNVYTLYRFLYDREREEAIENWHLESTLRPHARVTLQLDGVYHAPSERVTSLNTRLWAWRDRHWSLSAERRFRRERNDLWAGSLRWTPNPRWWYDAYGRYEFETDRLEEVGAHVQRNVDCMAWRAGVNVLPGTVRSDGAVIEDEWRIMIEFWLTAFPATRYGFEFE